VGLQFFAQQVLSAQVVLIQLMHYLEEQNHVHSALLVLFVQLKG
jgi:hypothetical protein